GLAERYGLQEQSARLIRSIRAATVGRLNLTYQLFRILHGIGGIRLNGHASFVRPLIYPMSVGALEAQSEARHEAKQEAKPEAKSGNAPASKPAGEPPSAEQLEAVKASNAASENYGNFYGQNLSTVQAGILIVSGIMQGLGYPVSVWRLVMFTTPI